MAEKLLPCPFCGASAETYAGFPEFEHQWHVLCDHDSECVIRHVGNVFPCEKTESEAAAAWNRRVPVDRITMFRKVESVLNIPSAGHASAGELADTILDALGFTGGSDA